MKDIAERMVGSGKVHQSQASKDRLTKRPKLKQPPQFSRLKTQASPSDRGGALGTPGSSASQAQLRFNVALAVQIGLKKEVVRPPHFKF
jgi:hypothetical protein